MRNSERNQWEGKASEQISTWNFESKKHSGFFKKLSRTDLKKKILGEIFRSLWRTTPFTQTDRSCCWCHVHAQQVMKGSLCSLHIYSVTVLADKALLRTGHAKQKTETVRYRFSYRYCMSHVLWLIMEFNLSWNGTASSPPPRVYTDISYCFPIWNRNRQIWG